MALSNTACMTSNVSRRSLSSAPGSFQPGSFSFSLRAKIPIHRTSPSVIGTSPVSGFCLVAIVTCNSNAYGSASESLSPKVWTLQQHNGSDRENQQPPDSLDHDPVGLDTD